MNEVLGNLIFTGFYLAFYISAGLWLMIDLGLVIRWVTRGVAEMLP